MALNRRRTRLFCGTLSAAAALGAACAASARDYYLDAAGGSDAAPATRTAPWKSLARVNATTFAPGDRILLKSGGVWTGQLFPKGSGAADAWITLDRYGAGSKPLLRSENAAEPVVLQGQQFWTIQNLAVVGGNRGVLIGSNGILSPQVLHGIHLRGLDVSGAAGDRTGDHAGIHLIPSTAAMDDVRIENCFVHAVNTEGIWLENLNSSLCTHVTLRGNRIDGTHGNGIVVNSTETPLVEDNVVYRCGAVNTDAGQAVGGLFPFKCHGGVFQHNEVAYTARSVDGYGFDLDEGCSGTFLYQYNYSHDNWGGFFEDTVHSLDGLADRCFLRDNISLNDGAGDPATHDTGKNAWGLFRLTGKHLTVYNNVFSSDRLPLYVQQWYNPQGAAEFLNNIFWCPNGFHSEADDHLAGSNPFVYDHNLFWGANGPADGTHQLNRVNPRFVRPGPVTDGFRALRGYRLQAHSPCRRAGRTITNNGGRDFFGNSLPLRSPDIGAAQFPFSPDPLRAGRGAGETAWR